MPGSAGGGHSGGFSGGGHSGSFGGSHSSSHSGSHSNSRSSHSGSFGSGSRNTGFSGSQNAGVYRAGGGYRRRPVYTGGGYPNRAGGTGGSGCLSGVFTAVFLPMIVTFAILFILIGVFMNKTDTVQEEFTGEMVSETVRLEKLSSELCKPLAHPVKTDRNDLLDAAGIEKLETALESFYGETGVQPYFMLLSGVNGSAHPDYDDVNDFLYNTYVDTFDTDEGHLIVLMLMENDVDYETWYIVGDDAVTVTGEAECDTLLTYIDTYAEQTTDVADAVARAFTVTGPEIMTRVDYYYYDAEGNEISEEDVIYNTDSGNKVSIAAALIFLTGIIVTAALTVRLIVKTVKKNKAPAPVNAPYIPPQNVSPQPPTQNPAPNAMVTCPYCGATAYPKSDGTCDYCGSKIV